MFFALIILENVIQIFSLQILYKKISWYIDYNSVCCYFGDTETRGIFIYL